MKSLRQTFSASSCESPLEKRLFYALQDFDLKFETQHPIGIFRVDFAMPEKRLVIEADGFDYHSSEIQRQRDEYRDRKIKSRGWRMERFPGYFIYRHSDVVASKIALKYCRDELKPETKKHAIGVLATFFASQGDTDLAVRLMKNAQFIS